MKMPIGAGRVVARFCIGSVRLELFTWGYGWWRCSIKILTGHGTDSSVCINGYWGENHLIVEKITDDIIPEIGGVVLRLLDRLSLFRSWSCRERSALAV